MDKKIVGRNIRLRRISRHMTQHELAEKTGATKSTVSNWESGRFMPGLTKLNQVAEALNVYLDDLTAESKIPEKEPEKLSIGDVIRSARKLSGYTQQELADALRVSQSTVGAWERELSHPTFSQLKEICLFFDISACELLGLACYQGDSKLFGLIKTYDDLSREGKDKLVQYAEDMRFSNPR